MSQSIHIKDGYNYSGYNIITNSTIPIGSMDTTPTQGSTKPVTSDGIYQVTKPFVGAQGSIAGIGGTVPAPQSGDENKLLRGDGTWSTITADERPAENSRNMVYSGGVYAVTQPFIGAQGSIAGVGGIVPAPQAGDNNKLLKGDGTWGTLPMDERPTQNSQNLVYSGGIYEVTKTFVGAQGSIAGIGGTVPAPQIGDANKVLKGDGTWGSYTTPTDERPTQNSRNLVYSGGVYEVTKPFVGVQGSIAGIGGTVPAPQIGDENKILYGNGTWGDFPFDLNIIAPYESSSISTRVYAVGEEFIYNGKLYKAMDDIDIGDAIVVGTNCEEASSIIEQTEVVPVNPSAEEIASFQDGAIWLVTEPEPNEGE